MSGTPCLGSRIAAAVALCLDGGAIGSCLPAACP